MAQFGHIASQIRHWSEVVTNTGSQTCTLRFSLPQAYFPKTIRLSSCVTKCVDESINNCFEQLPPSQQFEQLFQHLVITQDGISKELTYLDLLSYEAVGDIPEIFRQDSLTGRSVWNCELPLCLFNRDSSGPFTIQLTQACFPIFQTTTILHVSYVLDLSVPDPRNKGVALVKLEANDTKIVMLPNSANRILKNIRIKFLNSHSSFIGQQIQSITVLQAGQTRLHLTGPFVVEDNGFMNTVQFSGSTPIGPREALQVAIVTNSELNPQDCQIIAEYEP